jgi:hypothetical protein
MYADDDSSSPDSDGADGKRSFAPDRPRLALHDCDYNYNECNDPQFNPLDDHRIIDTQQPSTSSSSSFSHPCAVKVNIHKGYNMPSIDSFLIVANYILLFQVTVGKSHPVKADGLNDALKSIKSKNITTADTQTRLVFIAFNGTKLDSIQPFKNKSDVNVQQDALPPEIKNMTDEQWIVTLVAPPKVEG